MEEVLDTLGHFLRLYAPLAGLAVALLCLIGLFPAAGRRKLLMSMPICTAKGAFVGLIQLAGSVRCDRPFRTYLAEIEAVISRYDISEHWEREVTETYTDDEGRVQTRTRHESGWTSVASEEMRIPFELADDSGTIRIDPTGARYDGVTVFSQTVSLYDPLYYDKGPAGGIADSTGTRRFTEVAIPVNGGVYVAGTARPREDIAELEVAKGKRDGYFIIDVDGQRDVLGGLAWITAGWWIAAVAAIGIGSYFAWSDQITFWMEQIVTAVGTFAFVWLIGSIIHVRNAFVGVAQRLEQTISLVDVQLERRASLIPRLAETVRANAAHQADLQTLIAQLRAHGGARMVAERYPELTSNQTFLRLQTELTDTEDRIAAARGYYINALTIYQGMLDRFPEGMLARLMGSHIPQMDARIDPSGPEYPPSVSGIR